MATKIRALIHYLEGEDEDDNPEPVTIQIGSILSGWKEITLTVEEAKALTQELVSSSFYEPS